jgi:hypothetical protein
LKSTEDEVRAIATWLAAKLGNHSEAARWCRVSQNTLWGWLNRDAQRERNRRRYETNRDARREHSLRRRDACLMVTKRVSCTTKRLRDNYGTKTPASLRQYIRENVEAMCSGIKDDDAATWTREYDLDHVRPLGLAACDSAQERGETRPGFSGPADPHLMAVLHVSNLRWMRKADHHQKTTQDNADIARARASLRRGA